jgi:hypothetical protein
MAATQAAFSFGGMHQASVGEFRSEIMVYLDRKSENAQSINWQFTNEKARIKLKSLYLSICSLRTTRQPHPAAFYRNALTCPPEASGTVTPEAA